MASKGGTGSGSAWAAEQSTKEPGIMDFRMDMGQKHTQMEVPTRVSSLEGCAMATVFGKASLTAWQQLFVLLSVPP